VATEFLVSIGDNENPSPLRETSGQALGEETICHPGAIVTPVKTGVHPLSPEAKYQFPKTRRTLTDRLAWASRHDGSTSAA